MGGGTPGASHDGDDGAEAPAGSAVARGDGNGIGTADADADGIGAADVDTHAGSSGATRHGETGGKPGENRAEATPAELTGNGTPGGDFAPASDGRDNAGPLGEHFAEAVAMLARLPLSDAERAEAVRRLLAGANAATPTTANAPGANSTTGPAGASGKGAA